MPARKRATKAAQPNAITPRATTFLICQEVQQEGGVPTFRNVFSDAVVADFPAQVDSFTVASILVGGVGVFSQYVILRGHGLDLHTNEAHGFLINLHTFHNIWSRFGGVVFPEEGTYDLVMVVNGREIATTFLTFKRAERQDIPVPAGAAQP